VLAVLLMSLAGCAGVQGRQGSIEQNYELRVSQLSERGGQATTRFTVGSKDFAEQEILGHIALLALQAAGAEVVDRTALGDTEQVRNALLLGEIDMYWEYTGTGWLVHLAQADHPADSQELYAALARLDRRQNGVEWLQPAPADNTYALAVREDTGDADLEAVAALSDLTRLVQEHPEKATFCVGPEFSNRADGLPGLARHYGFEVPPANLSVLPDSTVYGALDAGRKCNIGSVFATNGLITELGLRLLDDDRGYFAPYHPALTMRKETLDRYPALADLFATIAGKLDTRTLRDLSSQVLVEKTPPEDVAERWLRDGGFIA